MVLHIYSYKVDKKFVNGYKIFLKSHSNSENQQSFNNHLKISKNKHKYRKLIKLMQNKWIVWIQCVRGC